MCGILCSILDKSNAELDQNLQIDNELKLLLQNRGPNLSSTKLIEASEHLLQFSGFVLWQQGVNAIVQPLISGDESHVLLLNGDIYNKRENLLQSDTEWLLEQIVKCENDEHLFTELFANIKGPFSIIYYNATLKTLYFMRDSLGRQSLLLRRNRLHSIQLSSIFHKHNVNNDICLEVPPVGIFALNLDNNEISVYPWLKLVDKILYEKPIETMESIFSNKFFWGHSIDPYWLQKENGKIPKTPEFSFETLLSNSNRDPLEIFNELLQNDSITEACANILNLLNDSVEERIKSTPPLCKRCSTTAQSCADPKVAILFSGGIDCTILSLLADKFVPQNIPIDLTNVSFEKVQKANNQNIQIIYDTPDRISARDSLVELKNLCPKRNWNLVEINVTRRELEEHMDSQIKHLVYPLNTVLDESLGAVLWFGANHYRNGSCRVLLIGSGADELFGGYTRHRNAFLRAKATMNPWEALEQELDLDWMRLPGRNLARDDRVIGDNGISPRAPFVQEDLSAYVRTLLPSQKCYHRLQEGVGDKLLLRLCGYRLGLREVCWLKKRAMQFGSRVADSKQNAKDVSKLL